MTSEERIGSRKKVDRLQPLESRALVPKLNDRVQAEIDKYGYISVQKLIEYIGTALADIGLYVKPDGNGQVVLIDHLGISIAFWENKRKIEVASYFPAKVIIHTDSSRLAGSIAHRHLQYTAQLKEVKITVVEQE